MFPLSYALRSWVVAGHNLLLACFPLCLLPVMLSGSALSAEGPVPPSGLPLAKGQFLIASPNLADPNFRHSVVLICEHSADGTLGLIMNRPTGVLLSEALPNVPVLKATSYVLFWGGPVQQDNVLMLFRVTQPPSGTREILSGIYLGGNNDALEQVITKPNPTETFRAFAGYAGWAPGQLEFEMAQGSWAIVTADSASIFDKDPANLWMDLLDRLSGPRVIRSDRPSSRPVQTPM